MEGCVDLVLQVLTLSSLSDELLTDWLKSELLETLLLWLRLQLDRLNCK
jgi:hypothetical protein